MRSSDWPYVVLTIAVFAISGSLFYVVGKRDAMRQGAAAGQPMVIIPIDADSDELRETLALRVEELERSGKRTAELTRQIESLRQSEARLKSEITKQAEQAAVQVAAAQALNAQQEEELDALASTATALEASIEILERELDNRRDKIAALEADLRAPAATEEEIETVTVIDASSGASTNVSTDVSTDEPSVRDDQTIPIADSPPLDNVQVASDLERGLLAYKAGRYEDAFATWMPLAKDGVRRAQFYVGGLYHDGRGVSADKLEAHYWATLSQRSGYPPSDDLLDLITAQMSDAELQEARARLLATTQGKLTDD
jgi:TPR repeat protein